MSIEATLERIADALDILAGKKLPGGEAVDGPVPAPKKITRAKAAKAEPAVDTVPGLEEPVAVDALADEPSGPKTGAELRAAAQGYITAADKVGLTGKLVTFIQSVAKIFNPAEPKLIKIPDAKVPEAAKMIADWCGKNGIKVG